MPAEWLEPHINCVVLAKILQRNVAANGVPNLTVFGQRIAERYSNEFHLCSFLQALGIEQNLLLEEQGSNVGDLKHLLSGFYIIVQLPKFRSCRRHYFILGLIWLTLLVRHSFRAAGKRITSMQERADLCSFAAKTDKKSQVGMTVWQRWMTSPFHCS